jgi:hypothetical protein
MENLLFADGFSGSVPAGDVERGGAALDHSRRGIVVEYTAGSLSTDMISQRDASGCDAQTLHSGPRRLDEKYGFVMLHPFVVGAHSLLNRCIARRYILAGCCASLSICLSSS